MDSRIQIITVCVALLLLITVLELVRRRRLLERYALLWLLSSLVLVGLAIWRGALDKIAEQLGVAYPPNALFIVAFGFVLWLLLHFSVAISRLSDQSKLLAQRLALLEERMRRAEEATGEKAFEVDEDERRQDISELPAVESTRFRQRAGNR
jgi:hypothetical protein